MPYEDKNFRSSLVLDFGIWWRHVKTIYCNKHAVRSDALHSPWVTHTGSVFQATMKLLFFLVLFSCISFGKFSHSIWCDLCFIEGIVMFQWISAPRTVQIRPTADRSTKPKHSEALPRTPDTKYPIWIQPVFGIQREFFASISLNTLEKV